MRLTSALPSHTSWELEAQLTEVAVYSQAYRYSGRVLFVTFKGTQPLAYGYSLEGADFFHCPNARYLTQLLGNEVRKDIKSFSENHLTLVR